METSSFHIRSYSRFSIQKGESGHLHIHPHTEIIFITEGRGYICSQGKKISVRQGMILIVKPGVKHTEAAAADEHLAYACIGVLDAIFDRQNDRSDEKDRGIYCLDFSLRFEKTFNYIRQIEREYSEKKDFWQYALSTYFNSFIVFIMRSFKFSVQPTVTPGSANVATMIRSYLFAHYQEDLTLEWLANYFNLSKYYIAHVYKKRYGISIITDLNEIRCEEAKNALEGSDSSITEIAAQVGFNSVAHFSETYKKIYSISPKEARNKFLGGEKIKFHPIRRATFFSILKKTSPFLLSFIVLFGSNITKFEATFVLYLCSYLCDNGTVKFERAKI